MIRIYCGGMTIRNLSEQEAFTTKDGSQIRSVLDKSNAPVRNQSLAEASIPMGHSTQRHFHKLSEEFYFVLEGSGRGLSSVVLASNHDYDPRYSRGLIQTVAFRRTGGGGAIVMPWHPNSRGIRSDCSRSKKAREDVALDRLS